MQFFPFACTALVKRGDNGEFHKQIKMRDVSLAEMIKVYEKS